MSKRGENIYKRKDGRWEGRYIKERSADGKARYAYVYGKSYADAKQKLLDRRITQAQNIDCSPSHTKYGDILRNWIAMSRIHIKESTYSRYVHLANAHILPYLGELPTGKLTTQTVEKHISFLLNKGRVDKKGGLAPKTVSDILTLIKGSIDYANCSGYSVNCYLDRLTVKKTQLDMRVLSVDEQHRLCDILMRDMNLTKFGVLLCMYTGIRIGEVCALKWERIDFSEGILSIRETLQRIQATDVGACKKTKIVITEPKSKKAVRDIPLPGFVLEYAASLKHNVKELVEKNYLTTYIDAQAGRSMRLLAVAKADGDNDSANLTLICVISIRDNVRKEAADAIKEVQNAGIQVVMVTGDRKETAVAIAKEAGLLSAPEDVALTSAEMAEKSDEELKAILPHLRVVSRALPTDKSRLVRIAQELNMVVGMTGDGVNDSPALKKADVGFAMGSGTEVAKEAGDITILDDNFSSIEKAILYGRTMFKSIRKFLIFQLTVNVAAVLTCFLGPLMGENVILTVIQLLLINLAMDTLAAIAFGSEPALKEYMKDKPVPRSESIISKEMMTEILVGALYITGICLSILFVPAIRNLFGDVDITYLKSAVFAVFMMAITFNGFNARTSHVNVFEHLGRNKTFIGVMLSIFALQFVFVTFGGEVLSVESLDARSWLICVVMAFMVIPIDMVRKLIMRKNLH